MSDRFNEDPDALPADLPPVEPPSAGFIVQLFVVPALIVLVIVAVWLGVNRLARSEQDWKNLIADVQSPHEHLRWRGAFGLAQMLQADEQLQGPGPRLVENSEVARQLAELLIAELKKGSLEDDDLKQQAFLARTLGLFHIPDAVLPALRQALEPEHDREIRKNALSAVAVLAGRAAEAGPPLNDPALLDDLLQVSTESDPLIRQLAAFDLGLLPGAKSTDRLEVMLEDADENVQANAAVGLARQGSTAGLPVLERILQTAADPTEAGSDAEYQRFLLLKNAVHAIDTLQSRLDDSQRGTLIPLLEPIATRYREPRIRIDAEKVLLALKAA